MNAFAKHLTSGLSAMAIAAVVASVPVEIGFTDGALTLKQSQAFAKKGRGGGENSGRRGGRDRADDNPTPGDDDGTPDQGSGDN
jgi:hypothetical protein